MEVSLVTDALWKMRGKNCKITFASWRVSWPLTVVGVVSETILRHLKRTDETFGGAIEHLTRLRRASVSPGTAADEGKLSLSSGVDLNMCISCI